MAANLREWTTEFSYSDSYSCVSRGSNYNPSSNDRYMANRYNNQSSDGEIM